MANPFGKTHTSTIGPDGQSTSFPIVGGPDCWFCRKQDNDPSSGTLLDIAHPDKNQPSSAFHELPDPFPVVAVFPNQNPFDLPPSRTTPNELATKVKRQDDRIPTETVDYVNADFKLLRSHFPGWSNIEKGTRFAMSLKTIERFLCFQRPVHFSVYAGPVDLKIKRAEVPDCMGGKNVVIRRFFTWKTTAFDLNYSKTTKAIWYSHEEKSPLENDPNFSRYTFLGRVKDEADDEYIQEVAEELQNEMNARGGYSNFQNNCWDFAFSLFMRIQYHGEGEGSG